MVVLLAVRFLAEIGMLGCLGIGEWRLGDSLLASLALSVVLPLVAAAVWGRWVARRAFLASIPARRYEPVLPGSGIAKGVK